MDREKERVWNSSLIAFIFILIVSFVTVIFIQGGSLVENLKFIILHSRMFFVNYMIVLSYFSIILWTKRKALAFSILMIIAAAFAILNYFVLSMRGTPFSFADINAAYFGLSIFFSVYDPLLIIIIGIFAFIIFGVLCFFAYKKIFRKNKIDYMISIVIIAVTFVSLLACDKFRWAANNAWAQNDYLSNGIIYNFYNSYKFTKVSAPDDYSEENVLEIISKADSEDIIENDVQKPNILFVQVEALMDPYLIEGIRYSSNPVSNISSLMENYTSGVMRVNVIGGSTVNTEFEILTGLPSNMLRAGDYPYLSIASYNTVESISFYLKKQGYKTTAIHNWFADFYNRDKVFANLGFDMYIPLEFMNNVERDEWYMKDTAFLKYLPLVLESTPEPDFIEGITVQMHGPYEKSKMDNSEIKVEGNYNQEIINNLERYVNKCYQTDLVIGELVSYFENFAEPVVCVFYGDHQPALEIFSSQQSVIDRYQVPYVIYSNYDMEREEKDLQSYQLSAYLLDRLNIEGGLITDFHSSFLEDSNYLKYLNIIQYDILAGEKYAYKEQEIFEPTKMQFGIEKIEVEKIEKKENKFIIHGKNFNISSKVFLNKKEQDCTYINSETLEVNHLIRDKDMIEIKQVGMYRAVGDIVQYNYFEEN